MISQRRIQTDYKRFRVLSLADTLELPRGGGIVSFLSNAGVAELADALDSKSSDRKIVWVRAPPPAERAPISYERE